MDKNPKSKIPACAGRQNPKFLKVYKKPQLSRYGKLTELTRGGGGFPKEASKKTRATSSGQG